MCVILCILNTFEIDFKFIDVFVSSYLYWVYGLSDLSLQQIMHYKGMRIVNLRSWRFLSIQVSLLWSFLESLMNQKYLTLMEFCLLI